MFKKRFLCYQQIVISKEVCGNTNNIKIDTVIRNVGAKNKEEALGKFITETSKIEAQQKLAPYAFLLDNLIKID